MNKLKQSSTVTEAQAILDCLRQTAIQTLERKHRLGHYAVIWQNDRPIAIGDDAPASLTLQDRNSGRS